MHKSKKYLSFFLRFIVTCSLFVYIFSHLVHLDDKVTLKTGEKLEGQITSQAHKKITFISEKAQHSIPYSEISSIERGLLSIFRYLDLEIFLLFTSFVLLGIFLSACRLKWLLQAQKLEVTYLYAIKINLIGLFFNNFLPGATGGDLLRAFYLAKENKNTPQAIAIIAFDRIMGMIGLVTITSLILLFFRNQEEFISSAFLVFSIQVAIFVGALVFFYLPAHFLEKLPLLIKDLSLIALSFRQDKKLLLKVLFISMTIHALSQLAAFGFLLAMGINNVPWYAIFIYLPVGLLIMSLPISLAGWGVGEAVYSYLLANFNLSSSYAVALALLIRFNQMFISLSGGIWWLLDGRKVKKPEDV